MLLRICVFKIIVIKCPSTKYNFVLSIAYLASLEDPDITELALHEYKTATNMTDQFAALAAISQNPGKVRDEVLDDFYSKWQHNFLVSLQLNSCFLPE